VKTGIRVCRGVRVAFQDNYTTERTTRRIVLISAVLPDRKGGWGNDTYIQQARSSHLRYGPAELLLMHVQAADPVQIHQLLIAACPEGRHHRSGSQSP